MSKKTSNDEVMKLVLSKLDKLDEKVDKTNDRLNSMDKTLVKQEENLKEHMRRTDLLEGDLKPIKKHVAVMNGAFKVLGICGTIVAIAVGIVKIFFGG